MLAGFHGHHSDRSVHVIRCGDDDRVNFVTKFRKQLAIVGKVRNSGKCRVGLVEAAFINVSEPDELHFGVGPYI